MDLAGSERVGKTGVKEKLLTEAVAINQALFFLEQALLTAPLLHPYCTPHCTPHYTPTAPLNVLTPLRRCTVYSTALHTDRGINRVCAQVIVALGERNKGKRTHIPYRNSMMTSVLRDRHPAPSHTAPDCTSAPSHTAPHPHCTPHTLHPSRTASSSAPGDALAAMH